MKMRPDLSVWYDVTGIMNWTGNLTGIERTVFELGLRLKNHPDVKFFVHSERNIFLEVEFPTHPKIREQITDPPLGDKLGFNKVLKKLAVKILPHFVFRVRAKIISKNLSKKELFKVDSKPIVSPFDSGDAILLFGASWMSSTLLEELQTVKKEKSLEVIHLIYDLIPILYPQYFNSGISDFFESQILSAVQLSDSFICISENTARDLAEFEAINGLIAKPKKTIRLGDDLHKAVFEIVWQDYSLKPGKFALVVGTIEARKNHLVLYQAWVLGYQRGLELPDLVLVGREGWLTENLVYQMKTDPRVKSKIHFLTDVSDEKLSWLYSNCLLTLYPSHYEGWGLPVAESLSYGKICITSPTSSLIEISSELVLYSDPYNPDEYLTKVYELYVDEEKRGLLEEKIVQNYKFHSWDDSFNNVIQALPNIL